jgi:glycosyltransferase involved in cell wall biosynthesis
MTRCAAFVGPLPPPVNGFSNMTAAMLNRLRTVMPVEIFDRSSGLERRFQTKLLQFLIPLRYLATCLRGRNGVLYLALSGGLGQIIDFLYVVIGKLFRRPIFIHHHSFAYINTPSWLNICFFALVRNERHIVLSRGMGTALKERYGLDFDKMHVVSNAAFLDFPPDDLRAAPDGGALPIQIGFLSNITQEKGFVEFFDILSRLRERATDFRARIAGPLAPESRDQFTSLLSGAPDVEYYGAVYGERKLEFYRQLDIFVFPTKYVNEAEPLVVYEAMSAGAYVIACDRGAIAEMLANDSGLVCSTDAIAQDGSERIRILGTDRQALALAQQGSLRQLRQTRAEAMLELDRLLTSMCR